MKAIEATALVIVGLLGLPATTSAQTLGAVGGLVTDKSGSVLPNVAVEVAGPALVESVRTAVTNGTGQYRIVDLPTGVYGVTFSLAGFTTVKRDGVQVSAGFTAETNAEMKVGSPTEIIVVTGERSLGNIPSADKANWPKIICGLSIMPADPSIDAKIRVPTVQNGVLPSMPMPTITPTICLDK